MALLLCGALRLLSPVRIFHVKFCIRAGAGTLCTLLYGLIPVAVVAVVVSAVIRASGSGTLHRAHLVGAVLAITVIILNCPDIRLLKS